MYTQVYTDIHTYIHTYIYIDIFIYIHTQTYTYLYIHTHTDIYIRTHIHTSRPAYTYIHTYNVFLSTLHPPPCQVQGGLLLPTVLHSSGLTVCPTRRSTPSFLGANSWRSFTFYFLEKNFSEVLFRPPCPGKLWCLLTPLQFQPPPSPYPEVA